MSIPYEERRAVYEAAIKYYGENRQTWKAAEEMGELLKALSKLYQSPYHAALDPLVEALVDELADVTIMMEQLRIIYDVNEEVQARMDYKIRRLMQRIGLEPGGARSETTGMAE